MIARNAQKMKYGWKQVIFMKKVFQVENDLGIGKIKRKRFSKLMC